MTMTMTFLKKRPMMMMMKPNMVKGRRLLNIVKEATWCCSAIRLTHSCHPRHDDDNDDDDDDSEVYDDDDLRDFDLLF